MHIRNQTTIYLIRHGETPHNRSHIRQGIQIDDYLDSIGIMQVQSILPIIKKLNLDILFTSYLHRGEETAALINRKLPEPVPIIHDHRLRERDFGKLTGQPQKDWDKLLPNNRELEQMQMYDYRPFGGENVNDVRERVISAIIDMIYNYHHQNIGIIGHNGVLRLLLFHFPQIIRIYRGLKTEKDIANTDIYEWTITENRIANLKSLLIR